MTDIRMSQMASGIPYGDNAERPLNPEIGTIYSNEQSRLDFVEVDNGHEHIRHEGDGVSAYQESE